MHHCFSQDSENTDLKRIQSPKIDPRIGIYIGKPDLLNSIMASSIFWKPCKLVRPKPQPEMCKHLQQQFLRGLKSEVLEFWVPGVDGVGILSLTGLTKAMPLSAFPFAPTHISLFILNRGEQGNNNNFN